MMRDVSEVNTGFRTFLLARPELRRTELDRCSVGANVKNCWIAKLPNIDFPGLRLPLCDNWKETFGKTWVGSH